jgi:hypothetical protein
MPGIQVDFQHWRHTFREQVLIRYGGPYFSAADAGKHLMREVLPNCDLVSQFQVSLDRRQVFCANEAYPEAALADPLADLDVWDEWLSGVRVFPYPGEYTPLGITSQEGKISSPSSVGVLGEVIAGVFSEAYVSPQVLVRVIRHWPDFIFYSGNGIYSFVESKAFTQVEQATPKLFRDLGIKPARSRPPVCDPERLSRKAFPELLVDAVHQLNADAFVKVWGAFTSVDQIRPELRLTCTFFEFDVPDTRRQSQAQRILPHAVIKGVAQRAVASASCELNEAEMAVFRQTPKQREKSARAKKRRSDRDVLAVYADAGPEIDAKGVEEKLRENALGVIGEILGRAEDDVAASESQGLIEEEIGQLVRGFVFSERLEGTRFFTTKKRGSGNILRAVRTVGNDTLLMGSLAKDDLAALDHDWQPNWENASEHWREIRGVPLWRFGGSVVCIGPHSLEGTALR